MTGKSKSGVAAEIETSSHIPIKPLYTPADLKGTDYETEVGYLHPGLGPAVDAGRIGVMGMSMGATRAWWLMALDERIRTGVPICCLTRYQNLIEHGLLKAHGIYYFVPGFLNHFDTEAVVALIAPRPVLMLNGDQDGTSPVDGVRAIESAVRPVYRLYGKDTAYQSIVYTGQGHVYTPEMWTKTLTWMDERLKGK